MMVPEWKSENSSYYIINDFVLFQEFTAYPAPTWPPGGPQLLQAKIYNHECLCQKESPGIGYILLLFSEIF